MKEAIKVVIVEGVVSQRPWFFLVGGLVGAGLASALPSWHAKGPQFFVAACGVALLKLAFDAWVDGYTEGK